MAPTIKNFPYANGIGRAVASERASPRNSIPLLFQVKG
jgi:hypothetical protein